jgi:hypothetical protein
MVLQEKRLVLNTGEKGKSRERTGIIRGRLYSFLIESDEILHVTIRFREFPDIILFNDVSHIGTRYVSVKVDSFNADNEVFNYNGDHYMLLDDLLVQVSGKQNSELRVRVRYDG